MKAFIDLIESPPGCLIALASILAVFIIAMTAITGNNVLENIRPSYTYTSVNGIPCVTIVEQGTNGEVTKLFCELGNCLQVEPSAMKLQVMVK